MEATRLLNLTSAATYLGLQPATLYEWVAKRKIEYVKMGRLLKFDRRQLDKWISQHTVRARASAAQSETTWA